MFVILRKAQFFMVNSRNINTSKYSKEQLGEIGTLISSFRHVKRENLIPFISSEVMATQLFLITYCGKIFMVPE